MKDLLKLKMLGVNLNIQDKILCGIDVGELRTTVTIRLYDFCSGVDLIYCIAAKSTSGVLVLKLSDEILDYRFPMFVKKLGVRCTDCVSLDIIGCSDKRLVRFFIVTSHTSDISLELFNMESRDRLYNLFADQILCHTDAPIGGIRRYAKEVQSRMSKMLKIPDMRVIAAESGNESEYLTRLNKLQIKYRDNQEVLKFLNYIAFCYRCNILNDITYTFRNLVMGR